MELQDVVLKVLDREHITTMVITHDVDEAIFMSDRICMMTSGPAARVGQMLEIPFARPRNREEVLEHPDYYDLRGSLVSFLEEQDHTDLESNGSQQDTEPTGGPIAQDAIDQQPETSPIAIAVPTPESVEQSA